MLSLQILFTGALALILSHGVATGNVTFCLASTVVFAFTIYVTQTYIQQPLHARTAEEELAADGRAPIVLLRNFDDDNNRHIGTLSPPRSLWRGLALSFGEPARDERDEVILGTLLRQLGPFVAIANPKHEELPVLGASRVYASHEAWQERVRQFLARAGLVVFLPHRTEGVMWEWATLTEMVPPEKIVVLLCSLRDRQKKYDALRSRLPSASRLKLPERIGGYCLTFNSQGEGRWEKQRFVIFAFLSLETRNPIIAGLERSLRAGGLPYLPPLRAVLGRLYRKMAIIILIAFSLLTLYQTIEIAREAWERREVEKLQEFNDGGFQYSNQIP